MAFMSAQGMPRHEQMQAGMRTKEVCTSTLALKEALQHDKAGAH